MAGSGVDLISEGLALLASEGVEGRWLGDELIGLFGSLDRLRAECSRRVGEFDGRGDAHGDGHRSTVGWLVDRCRLDSGDATREVRLARTMRALPSVKAAWEQGATTSAHVHALRRVRHRAKSDAHFDQLEDLWEQLCREQDTDTLDKALAGFLDRLDNTRPVEESSAADAIARRMLAGSRALGVGMLEGRWDLVDYDTIFGAVEHERELQHVEGDERTVDQQRADALAGICQKYLDNTDPRREHPPVINVLTDVATLAGLQAGLCETDSGLPLYAETVRRLSCHAEIGRILVGAGDEILNLGRTRRLFSKAQRRAMRYRDRGCCFPGCSRSVRQCRAHHMDPWSHGDPTISTRAACSAGSTTASSTNSAGPSSAGPTPASTGTAPTATTTAHGTHPDGHHRSDCCDPASEVTVMDVTIRDADLADMPALADVFRRASLANEGDRPNLLANPEVLEYGDAWVRAGLTRAAEIGGQIVGFITGIPNDGWIEVEDLFTDPEWMRRGVATALVRDLVAGAAAAGVPRVEVTGNFHARAFYESVGFVGGEVVPTRWDPALRMRLDVATHEAGGAAQRTS